MEKKLYGNLLLHIPTFNELEYRKKLLMQSETMSYNKGYNLEFDGYDNETGCIDFRREVWNEWYDHWCKDARNSFYAYLSLHDEKTYIGEVNFHYSNYTKQYEIGIIIEAKYRGKGYCSEGLIRLSDKAFKDFQIDKLCNEIPLNRVTAIEGHKSAGFKEVNIRNHVCYLELTKEDFYEKYPEYNS